MPLRSLRWLTAALLVGPLSACNVAFNGCLPLTSGTAPGPDRIGVGVSVDAEGAAIGAEVAFTYLEQAGVTWARVPFAWADIQPTRDTLDWRIPDALVATAKAHGIKLHVVLKDTPQWASISPFAGAARSSPPASMTDWFRFALLVSTRYKENVDNWEIWEGIDRYKQWSGRPEQYMQLLSWANKAIKLTNPQDRLIMGGLTLANDRNSQFLDLCLHDRTHPADTLADAIAFAPGNVTPGELRERLYAIRRDLRLNQVSKPILVTNLSWSSERSTQGACDAYQGGEAGQARYVRDIVPWLIGLGSERVFWQPLWDGAVDSPAASLGLLDRQLQAKAALGTIAGLVDPSRIGKANPVATPEATSVPGSDATTVPTAAAGT